MADYYTSFSCELVFPVQHEHFVVETLCGTAEPLHGLAWQDDESVTPEFEWEITSFGVPGKSAVWIHGDEGGSIDDIETFVCYIQKALGLTDGFICEWSHTCSKPRLDGFGGGVLVCYKGESRWMNTTSWAEKELQKMGRKRKPK